MTVAASQPVLILGMHRSGTSYLANRLQALGVDLGTDLVGPQPGNPRGHFEDRSILAFHEALIAARRSAAGWAFDDHMMVTERLGSPWTAAERERGESLIAARTAASIRPSWGWKEPRTALFIDSWRALLPDMRGVVIFRHPLAVHFSALRRKHWDLVLFPDQVLRAYATYNRSLLDAIERAPERYLVVHADTAFGALDRLDAELRRFLDLPADAPVEPPRFHAEEFAGSDVPPAAEAWLRRLVPEAMEAYDALNRYAALPAPAGESVEEGENDSADSRWLETIDDWSSERRAFLVPLLETRWFESSTSPGALRIALAEEIGRKVRKTEGWNARAARIYEDNERLAAECKRLGDSFAEQQAFLHRHTEDFSKLWEKHKELGNSWVQSNERVAAQARQIEALERRLREAGLEPPPRPTVSA